MLIPMTREIISSSTRGRINFISLKALWLPIPKAIMAPEQEDIVYFSIAPRYYLNLAMILRKNQVLSEAERYLAYLVICQDKDNPMYQPAMNGYARAIYQEFQKEGNRE